MKIQFVVSTTLLVMTLSLLPFSALAEEGGAGPQDSESFKLKLVEKGPYASIEFPKMPGVAVSTEKPVSIPVARVVQHILSSEGIKGNRNVEGTAEAVESFRRAVNAVAGCIRDMGMTGKSIPKPECDGAAATALDQVLRNAKSPSAQKSAQAGNILRLGILRETLPQTYLIDALIPLGVSSFSCADNFEKRPVCQINIPSQIKLAAISQFAAGLKYQQTVVGTTVEPALP